MMKTYFFLSVCMIFIEQISAQPYESIFGETSASWNIYEEIPDAGETDSIFISSDTIFNGFTYKYFTDGYDYKRGGLREDTVTGKVWFYSINNEIEYLAMDMNLNVGDTFFLNPPAGVEFYAIVDSVYTLDDKKHIHFDYPLLYGDDSLEFIEGVGPNAGINFQETNSYAIFSHLLCAQKDAVQTYHNSVFGGVCRYTWTTIENVWHQSMACQIIPDPFYDRAAVTFNNPQRDVYSCFIHNSALQLISMQSDITDDHIVLERNDLLSGLYFISLVNNKGSCISGTFILL